MIRVRVYESKGRGPNPGFSLFHSLPNSACCNHDGNTKNNRRSNEPCR